MWPFDRKPTIEELRGHKKIVVNGMKFVIKKINPIVDFKGVRVPQVFANIDPTRMPTRDRKMDDAQALEDMKEVVMAGVVIPKLGGLYQKDNPTNFDIKVEDLFRDPMMGSKLYIEIMAHSLNAFKGIKGWFFFRRIKLILWTQWLAAMGKNLQRLRLEGAS